MSIWKRKKKKLEKTEKPEDSVKKDFVETLTYNKDEEEKKKTLTEVDADKKITAVPVVITHGGQPQQSTPQQIVININIPAPLNKSEMPSDHKADMPKPAPAPATRMVTAKAPVTPKPTVIQKSNQLGEVIKSMPAEKAAALLKQLRPGKNLKKNMAMGYPGMPANNLMQAPQAPAAPQPVSNLAQPMQMSEPLQKDVVDLKTRQKIGETGQDLGEQKSTTEKIKNALSKQKLKGSPYAEERPNAGIAPLKEEQHKPVIKNKKTEHIGSVPLDDVSDYTLSVEVARHPDHKKLIGHHILLNSHPGKDMSKWPDELHDAIDSAQRDLFDRVVVHVKSNEPWNEDKRPYGDLGKLKDSKERIKKLMTDIKSEPLKKDVVDMSKWKRRKQKETDNLPTDPKQPDTRSRDQKIKDALKAQAKQGSPYADNRTSATTGVKKIKQEIDVEKERKAALSAKKARQNPKDKKYRQLLDQRDSGDSSLKSKSDIEIAKMAGIQIMEPAKPKQMPEPSQDTKGYYQARFGDNPEALKRIEELWSKDHDEPYSDGVLGQTNWRQGKDILPKNLSDKDKWKEMPIASKTTPESIGGVLGKKVITGEGPDPFHFVDTKYGHTKRLLAEHKDLPLKIHTRSDLIAHDDYMEYLNPQKHEVNIHVAFPENKWDMSSDTNVMEPGQPSTQRRLSAYKKLKEAGIPVKIIVDRLKSDYEHPLLTNNKIAASQLRQMGIPKEDIDFNEVQLDKYALERIALGSGVPPHNPNRKKRHLSEDQKASNLTMIKEALSRRRT